MMALAIILEKQFQEQFNMGEFSPLNIALAVGEEKSPGGWKMIFKASHRAGAESFLKTKSLHIRAFLIQSSIAFHIIKEQRVKYLPVLSIGFRKFVSDKMKQCAGTPAMERLRSAFLP